MDFILYATICDMFNPSLFHICFWQNSQAKMVDDQ